MKMSKKTLIVILIALMCLLCFTTCKEYPNTPPPDYKIVCDSSGHYAPMMPGGWIIETGFDGELMTKREEALERAWEQYWFIHKPEPIINWSECK